MGFLFNFEILCLVIVRYFFTSLLPCINHVIVVHVCDDFIIWHSVIDVAQFNMMLESNQFFKGYY